MKNKQLKLQLIIAASVALTSLGLSLVARENLAASVEPATLERPHADVEGDATVEASGKHPVYFSEYKLRSTIAAANGELRELKRKFMRQMTDVYLTTKMDSQVGAFQAAKEENKSPAATVVTLMNVELADMIIKKHIIQRRLVSGLKVGFVKMLPLRTLRRLIEKFKAYAWLEGMAQVDVRPKFANVRENHLVILYTLIELRARARAADDLYVLTADSARRVLQAVQFWLIESRHGPTEVGSMELDLMARYALKTLRFYMAEVFNARLDAMAAWQNRLDYAKLVVELAGGKDKLVAFIDGIIDAEALDIDLNVEAERLDWPPTISDDMIANLEPKWIPEFVLKSLGEDRRTLVERRRYIMSALVPEQDKLEADLGQWAERAIGYLSSNKAVTWSY